MMWPVTCANVELGTDAGLTAHLHGDDMEFR
jgi:hypothetical protein